MFVIQLVDPDGATIAIAHGALIFARAEALTWFAEILDHEVAEDLMRRGYTIQLCRDGIVLATSGDPE